jgi:N-acetylglutamate synthase-like GNAT family acetyltransferase
MSLTIRAATEDDQPTIQRLIREVHLPRMNLQWANFVVAEEDHEVVGMGQVKSHGDGSRELASIAVVPARQDQGIGNAIIQALLSREPGVVLHLSCRRELEGYYERFGFKRLEPAAYPPYFRRTTLLINRITRFFGLHLLVMRREADR